MQQPHKPAAPRRWWPRRLLNRLEVNRATFFALALRIWQLAGGAITMLLIALLFSSELQGYYFTFAGLMAWQSIFELGFSVATTNVASHEWSRLELDERGRIAGDPDARSRLVSLGRIVFRWYAIACLLFIVVIGCAGAWMLGQKADDVAWQAPWTAMILLTALLSWMLPANALLEGCNQVAVVNRFRLIQATVASAAMWLGLILGWGLWVPVAGVAARVLCNVYLLCVRYRHFFRPFWKRPAGARMDWRREVWPLQWRLAVQGITAFCTYAIVSPVMFYYHGASVAGQMGMTWAVITAVQAAALAWVQTRVPRFGMLIARQDYRELNRVFSRLVVVSLWAMVAAAAMLIGVIISVQILIPRLGERLLPLAPTSVFLVGVVLFHVPQCQALYLRAHRRDPLLVLSTITNVGIGLSIWILGCFFGPLGAAIGFTTTIALFTLPATTWLWRRCRAEWHAG